jgi:glycosidase
MTGPRYPALYQINTRAWLYELGATLGRPATLEDVSDASIEQIAADGFDWVWLLGIWQTGDAGHQVSLSQPEWQAEYHELLPDFTADDVCGSPFAIRDYVVNRDFGGPRALERFRKRLADRRVRLMLDFVPNHTALDHPWARQHPEYYVRGSHDDLAREPKNYCRVVTDREALVLAHGRDPYFPGWPDTLQVNYRHAGFRQAMLAVLESIAGQCDGVRCDMAMLVLPDVIARTWGDRALPSDGSQPVDAPFWPAATEHVRRRRPGFLFMAEAYWDLEWTLQQQGFDYTYDKRLYDRLREAHARPVREHFHAGLDYQNKLARFLENHDEPRVAATFAPDAHQAAAIITFLSPGLRFFHQGQFEGRRKRISPHLVRAPVEAPDPQLQHFYDRLLALLREPAVRDGQWQLLECAPAWEENWTSDCFLASVWQGPGDERLFVAVNYAPNQSQCFVRLPFTDLDGRQWRLEDRMEGTVYDRDGCDLQRRGLYLDMRPWQASVFTLTRNPSGS